jgi:hypothetical protein
VSSDLASGIDMAAQIVQGTLLTMFRISSIEGREGTESQILGTTESRALPRVLISLMSLFTQWGLFPVVSWKGWDR